MSHRLLAPLAVALSLSLVPAAASAATPPRKSSAKTMRTKVIVKQFVVRKTGLTALGTAATSVGGATTRQAVTLRATTGSTCQVLSLHLDRLNLALLGLRLDVSTVNLKITGNRARTLGALFCRLATATKLGKLRSARSAALSLNRRLRSTPLQMVGFSARLYPQTVPADAEGAPQSESTAGTRQAGSTPPPPSGPTCPVLDLTLGPLNLDLLGLVVDLYGATSKDPVRVTAVADPAAGILGKALCQISTQQPQA